MPEFMEGERVVFADNHAFVGTVDIVREHTDPDTDVPTGATIYTVAWKDGQYSEHMEDELQAATEEL